MTEDELRMIKEHIEIHARREPRAIKITQILWKAVEELEETKEQQEENKELNIKIDRLESACNAYNYSQRTYQEEIKELKNKLEKLIDFVVSRIECCDVCPITDTCINSEGICPYAGILDKGEEVIREWLMQKIVKEIKENE